MRLFIMCESSFVVFCGASSQHYGRTAEYYVECSGYICLEHVHSL